jgi:acetyl esterase/lipase
VPDSIQLVRDVIYAIAPGDNGTNIELKMDTAFLKQSDGKPMPVVVYIHGGGWSMGSKDMGMRPGLALAQGGYFAVSIQYRLTGQAIYPAAVHDCKAAIRFLRAHAEELGIDPNRIGVWGHSAGGHLSALLGTTGNTNVLDGSVGTADSKISASVQCVVDISGPIDLTSDFDEGMISQWLGGPVKDRQDLAKQASPLTYVDAEDPPVLIIHGTEDRLVNMDRHARKFEKAMKDAGASVEFLPVQGEGHMIANPRAYLRAAEFFDAHLGGNAAASWREAMQSTRGADAERPRPDRPNRPAQPVDDPSPSDAP